MELIESGDAGDVGNTCRSAIPIRPVQGLGNYEAGSHVAQSRCRVAVLGHCVYDKDPQVIDGCDRSSSAYNSTVSGTYVFVGGKQTWASSDSITRDIYDAPNDPSCSQGHASGPTARVAR